MLFNSYLFILLFLPLCVSGFYLIRSRHSKNSSIFFLIGASFLFYGWWNPKYLILLVASITGNYLLGSVLSGKSFRGRKALFIFGIIANLGAIGYFKYANFFVDSLAHLFGSDFQLGRIVLPLAISFFTFQQIAFLVDVYKNETKSYSFPEYCLFVAFFPQLIAGPIVHHNEVIPQFPKDIRQKVDFAKIASGLMFFIFGLLKKVAIADSLAPYATMVFSAPDHTTLTLFAAWKGALAYTFQLYFDFSGYSDMAIGIALLFGIKLPYNFNSPYKAANIIDFWKQWHITLSRFLKTYLYIPLGGNRNGKNRRYVNLMITMLLGGLWHGAGWTFVIWGGLHGLYLTINHFWRGIEKKTHLPVPVSRFITFGAIVIAWVFFRAENVSSAFQILSAMFGGNGFGAFLEIKEVAILIVIMIFLLCAPNTQSVVTNIFDTTKERRKMTGFIMQPNAITGVIFAALLFTAVIMLEKQSEFLYFQF